MATSARAKTEVTKKNDKTVLQNVSGVQTISGEKKTRMKKVSYQNQKIKCKSLVIDGTKYRTLINQKFEKRNMWVNPDQNKIISFIPGTIVKLYAKEGQQVKKGENMLILEAMKMKNRIVFPHDGMVKSVNVKEGEKIPKHFLMIELE